MSTRRKPAKFVVLVIRVLLTIPTCCCHFDIMSMTAWRSLLAFWQVSRVLVGTLSKQHGVRSSGEEQKDIACSCCRYQKLNVALQGHVQRLDCLTDVSAFAAYLTSSVKQSRAVPAPRHNVARLLDRRPN